MEEAMSKVVTASVGPVIVISACGLLSLAFYNRLAAIVTRIRMFQRESLAEQEKLKREPSIALREERTRMVRHLERQTRNVLVRARLIRGALFCLLGTILCLAACSLALGAAVLYPRAYWGAAALFVLGMALLMGGVILAMCELGRSLDPVTMETEFVALHFGRQTNADETHGVMGPVEVV